MSAAEDGTSVEDRARNLPADHEAAPRKPAADPDSRLPSWLVRHPLHSGWAWTALCSGLILLGEFIGMADWAWYILVGLAALPTLAATLAVLQATPRRHLKPPRESVLGHFFVRFLALAAAFLAWWLSIVASASISSTIQMLAGDSEREVTSLGFNLLLTAVPLVLSVLWISFVVRCVWFLRRLRGWRESPEHTRLPGKFLRGRPRLRRVVIGLAHPGLLLVAGVGTAVLGLLLSAVEVTVELLG